MMIRVTVNSKSELVEDRERKSALYGVICSCDDRLLSRAVIHVHVKRAKLNCTNQQPPRRGGGVPNRVWVGSKWLLAFPRVPVTPGTPLTQTIFSPCSPLNDRRKVARCLFKIGLSSLFSCLALARLFTLLFLLISGNVHSNPCLVFPCLVCAGNVTWRDRSVQCCR